MFKDDFSHKGNNYIIKNKGIINNKTSAFLMTQLARVGIKNHFIKTINNREQQIHPLEMYPFKIIVRNFANKKTSNIFGYDNEHIFCNPVLSYVMNINSVNPYFLTENELINFNLINNQDELLSINSLALRINDFLRGYFLCSKMKLEFVNLQFGKKKSDIEEESFDFLLGDELTLENCGIIDLKLNSCENNDNLISLYSFFAKKIGVEFTNHF